MAVIAVDMTPVLPGGENGGAKIFSIELLKSFHRAAPNDRFLLLTAHWNHEELSFLDSSNMNRICILKNKPPFSTISNTYGLKLFENIMRKTYLFFRRKLQVAPSHHKLLESLGVAHLFCFFKRKLQASSSHHKLLESLGVNLLFCPLTALNYFVPGIPAVSIIYDLQHFEYPYLFSPEEVSARNCFYIEVSCKANTIICISEYTRKKVIEHLSVSPDRCHTVPINIHDRFDSMDPGIATEHLKELGILRHPYLFYPANFWPHKNHRMLLVAFSLLLSRNSDLNLDLIFTGTIKKMESKLKLDVKKLGLENRVHFIGFISQEKLRAVWKGCEFLIFPSLYEGFGIPILEAMAFGKQVLCSNTTSLPEVAGNAALYFDPRKPDDIVRCLEEIAGNPKLKNELRNRGYRRVEKFKKEAMVQRYLDIFKVYKDI